MEPTNNNEIYEQWRAKFAELDNVNSIDFLMDLVLTTNRRIDELNTNMNHVFSQIEQAFQHQGAAIQKLQADAQDKPRLILP